MCSLWTILETVKETDNILTPVDLTSKTAANYHFAFVTQNSKMSFVRTALLDRNHR